ncbi:MAG TPA: maleylpyruvate isomerase family mycothiol-dependent enzyme [Pseudonocardiaceae bacterium]|nr:maleylpyruvate isomerase family mycothiol-dependent enzyme [Pseudonocardiaceae bacterium]
MSELADRTIAALHAEHDTLVALLADVNEDQLNKPSGAGDWTVAQVLSHLGSGAEIGRAPIARAAGESVEAVDNQTIWARWDAASPADQATGFVRHNTRWLDTVDALTPEQRSSLTVDLGFLPEPVPLVTALGMRLNEVANHVWDARVTFDPGAEVNADSAAVLVDLFTGSLSFLLGFTAKPGEVSEPVSLAAPGAGLVIDDAATVRGDVTSPTATFHGSAGAFIRLLTGRLKDPYATDVTVEGNVTLDDLRRVFPGY